MTWNVAAECISVVVLSIIWIYSRKGNVTPNLKNRLFQGCLLVTFLAMTTNIASVVLIDTLSPATLTLTWITNMIYFIATPLMGLVYYLYVLANVYEDEKLPKGLFSITFLPGTIYMGFILANPWTRNIFDITLENGYTQEKYRMITYAVFYFYCLLCVLVVSTKWKQVQSPIRVILASFPVVAAIVIIVQLIFPEVILSGSAATCALLLIYLFLQNKQISIDYLTNLSNRQEFSKMLELKCKKGASEGFSIIILSIREFKTINDTYGQHNGDAFLVAISEYLQKNIQSKKVKLYRYSGDEFAILIEGSDVELNTSIVTQIYDRMLLPWETKEAACIISSAIGIVRYPETTTAFSGLINGIEYAVILAKNSTSGNHICYCGPDVLEKARRRQQIWDIMKQYLDEDRFDVYYQPIYATETEEFPYAEALLRIKNSHLGDISPVEFIPIAEESGLIIDITYMVLEKVCKCIRVLMDQGTAPRGISVNFSYLQFTQPNLMEKIMEILQKYQVPTSKIKIEFTESTLAENPEAVEEVVTQMKAAGLRIVLDDFGTGFSNLKSVIMLPFDTIKLDKSLLWSAMENEKSSIMVRSTAEAFKAMGSVLLAEGVETKEQQDFVVDCGGTLIQGFLYAKPMPEEEYKLFLDKKI